MRKIDRFKDENKASNFDNNVYENIGQDTPETDVMQALELA